MAVALVPIIATTLATFAVVAFLIVSPALNVQRILFAVFRSAAKGLTLSTRAWLFAVPLASIICRFATLFWIMWPFAKAPAGKTDPPEEF